MSGSLGDRPLAQPRWRTAGWRVLLCLAVIVWPATVSAQVVEYYHLDSVGNVLAVTDTNGAVVEQHDYLPFGEEWCGTGVCGSVTAGQPKRFTGTERDGETGLDYFGARYYAPRIGRFTTVDPVYTIAENLVDPQRWNRYAYGRGNPFRYVDPDGRELRIAGHPEDAVAALQAGVPASDRGFIRVVEQDGHVVVDARALNDGRGSQSENFLAIRQIANSPGVVELNVSAGDAQYRSKDGAVATIPLSSKNPGVTNVGRSDVNPGVSQVFVAGGLDSNLRARVTAHELRHARRHLLGQRSKHEVDKAGERISGRPVNAETDRAAAEAARNEREH